MTTQSNRYDFSHLRFCIPFPDLSQGGMYSFFRNFRQYLREHEISFTDCLDDEYDILIINSWVISYPVVLKAKKTKSDLRILHRIDGSAQDYGRDPIGDKIQGLINTLADVTVFQSKYGRFATTKKFPVISQIGPVIYNSVNVKCFAPEGETLPLPGKYRICHVTYSQNKNKGADEVYDLAQSYPFIDFFLVGLYERPPLLKNLHVLGQLDWDTLPKVLRSCDAFLTFSQNETCPNVVLEALACGLPILFKKSGGTDELVGECGVSVEVGNFEESFHFVVEHRSHLSEAARSRAVQVFDSEVIFPQYLKAAAGSSRHPLPGFLEETVGRGKTLVSKVASWLV